MVIVKDSFCCCGCSVLKLFLPDKIRVINPVLVLFPFKENYASV